MTNADKYLKDGVKEQLIKELSIYGGELDEFFEEQAKSTLTEEERVILRNIDIEAFNTIGRRKSGGLYVRFIFQGETYNASIFNDNVFQFIKERRRIRDSRTFERRITMTVKELIEKLKKCDGEREVYIRFALDKEDDIGYIFKTVGGYEYLDDRLYIIGEDVTTSEEYTSVGQFDLKELYKKAKEELLKGE